MHLLSFSNIILAGIFAVHGALAAGAGVSPSLSLDRPRGYRFGKPVAPHPAAPIHGGGPDVYRPDYKESGGAVASTIHILDNPYLPLQPASDEDHPGSVLASNLAPEDPTIANGARFTAPALARTREVSPDVEGLIGGCKKMSGKVAVTQVTTGLTVGFLAFNPYQVLFPDSTTAFLMDTVGYTMRASDIVSFTACPDKPFTASVFIREKWPGGPGADFPITAIHIPTDYGIPELSNTTYFLGTVPASRSEPARSDVLWELATDGSNTLTAAAGAATLLANFDHQLVLMDLLPTDLLPTELVDLLPTELVDLLPTDLLPTSDADSEMSAANEQEVRFTFVPDTIEPA